MAKAYIANEVTDKLAQHIIKVFKIQSQLKEHETVLAVLGLYNSIISTEDRLIYDFSPTIISDKFITIYYSEITKIEMRTERRKSSIYITSSKQGEVKIDIHAAEAETAKFYSFISSYKPPEHKMAGFDAVSVVCPNCCANNNLMPHSTEKCEYCGSIIKAE